MTAENQRASKNDEAQLPGKIALWIGGAFIAYLAWRLVAPFVPALAFAFALAMLGEPLYSRLEKKLHRKNTAAFTSVVVICLTLVIPVIFLAQVLAREVIQGMGSVSADLDKLRSSLERIPFIGPWLSWLDSQLDLPDDAVEATRGIAQWASSIASLIVTRSAWAITQIATTLVVLFYFLRDQESILTTIRSLVPLREDETDQLFARITETIRISLYGKVVVSAVQGGLGGLIFWWLDLPAPAFWGFIMALLSVLPVLGAFVIWLPAAATLALQGYWARALLLTGWGVLVVHPVDNLLGPVLVGTKLHFHTLLMFFAVIGGLAAFGAAGIVLGPVIVAVAVSLFEIRNQHKEPE
jgi:predicted PurR-regulated permease PerM